MVHGRKTKSVPLAINDVRTAIARMLVLAKTCERYLDSSKKSPYGKRALKKMERIAKELAPLSGKQAKWIDNMHVGAFVDNVCGLYKNFHEKNLSMEELISELSRYWHLLFNSPPGAHHLKTLSCITRKEASGRKEIRGHKEAAVINVAEVLGFDPSHVWKICRRYKEDAGKMVGRVLGIEEGFFHHSFTEEPTWRFLFGYYLEKLMGIPVKDSCHLQNHIGDLIAKQKAQQETPGG